MKDFKMPKKILSVLLAVSMMLSCVPAPAYAVTTDNLCEHHTAHTADCGYAEAVAGVACTHEHSEDCYAIVACIHAHDESCGTDGANCTHDCTVESGCVTMALDCHHTHDGSCGYSEGTAEVPCGHQHDGSCGYVEAVAEVLCACTETDESGALIHAEDCGYVAPVEGVACGHTEHLDCGYAPATEGTPCTHTHAVKVASENSCYKLLCSHKDGGHDDACGYVAAVEAHECHYECAECVAALTADETTASSTEATEPSTEPAPVCDCGTDDPAIHATTCAVYVAPETAVCYCTEKCSDTNVWCDVCGFDYTQCGGTDTATVYADDWFKVSGNTVTIDGTLGGKTTAEESDITALVDAIKGYVDSGITTITVTSSEPALYNFYDVYTPAVSVAIFRLTEDSESSVGSGDPDSPYCGKIDLILQDVTEIVEMEFNNSFALNSITLPKVTKLGAQAFALCNYLQTITFGSVVTEGIENGEQVFNSVGSKVDGGLCNLVLSCGQVNAATEYQPNIETKEWWKTPWKHITLAHTNSYQDLGNGTHSTVCSVCGGTGTEDHSGGEATCTTLAICSGCGVSYGEVDSDNHTAEPAYSVNEWDNTQHDVYYSCCGATVTEDHIGNPVAVDEFYHKYEGCCGAVDHTGMEPDGICDVCEFAQYDVWVDAIRITSLNKDDVLNDSGSLKYAPDTYTLTVSGNVTVNDSFNDGINNYGIYAKGELVIIGDENSSLTVVSGGIEYGIGCVDDTYNEVYGLISVKGGMTLNATGSDTGIYAHYVYAGTNDSVSEPNDTSTINANGGSYGIRASDVSLYDANLVTATGNVGIAHMGDYSLSLSVNGSGHLIAKGEGGALSLGENSGLDLVLNGDCTGFWRFAENGSFESGDDYALSELESIFPYEYIDENYLEIIASGDMTYAADGMTCSHGVGIDVAAKLEYTYNSSNYILYFSDLQPALDGANAFGPAITNIKLTLLRNVTVTDAPLTITDDLPLDLAGYQISGNINGALLEVATNENVNTTGALTITDSSTGKTGSISNTHTDGIGVKVSAGTLTIEGGAITGTKAGIYLADGVSSITVASSDISGSTVDMETPGLFATAGTGVTLKADMFTSARDGYIVDQGDSGLSLVVCDHSGSQHESATDKGDGTHSFTCTVCGEAITEAHSAEDAGDCTTAVTCTICGTTITEARNHSYTNGFCTNTLSDGTVCDDYQPCEGSGTEADPYKIGNAGQLYWFAEQVNGGRNTINAVLTEDIKVYEGTVSYNTTDARPWTPIGNDTTQYTGTFDGDGHTISGLFANYNGSGSYVGLIGYLGVGGTVKRLSVTNSILTGGNKNYGLIAGYNAGTIENCSTAGSVSGNMNMSGLAGYNEGRIVNCYTTASVSGGTNLGYLAGVNYGTVMNSYCSGPTSEYDRTGPFGYQNGTVDDQSGIMTADRFASGEVAYLLQGEQTEHVWGQTIGTDSYPTLGGAKVYAGYDTCANDAAVVYSNTELPAEKPHIYENGICEAVEGEIHYEPAKQNESGIYEIGNAGQLMWFAEQINSGAIAKDVNAILIDNIDMTGIDWTPICSTGLYYNTTTYTDKGYEGTFDGGGYTISNLKITGTDGVKASYGLFGTLSGTVKNLGMRGMTFSYADTYDTNTTDARAGAIAGQMLDGSLISDCFVVDSSLTPNNYIVGGIAGCNYAGTIQNCYTKNVTISAHSRCGNLVSDTRGDISTTDRPGTVKNCYTDASRVVGTNTSGSEYITGCVANILDSIFASGEITYKLNGDRTETVWYQKDGMPAFSGSIVYENTCGGDTFYSTTDGDFDSHNIGSDYRCTNCGSYDPAILVTAENYSSLGLDESYVGYYAIKNASNLYWYSERERIGDISGSIVLLNDITLDNSKAEWIPIGWDGDCTFDGRGNTITLKLNYGTEQDSASYGLFGTCNYSVVKNLFLDGYLTVNTTGNVGAVAASMYRTTISGVISTVNVTNTCTTGGNVGGLVGYFGGQHDTTNNQYSKIENCAVYADVTGYNAGGLVGQGWNGNQYYDITNAAYVGNVTTTDTTSGTAGAIVGYQATDNYTSTFTNIYWNKENGLGFYGKRDTENQVYTNTEAKTAEQFASGEVAWLLNGESPDGIWKQTIGLHDYPVFSGATVDFSGGSYGNTGNFIYVEISWTEMSFTYTGAEWNPETHAYENSGWVPDTEGGGTVTVTNKGSAVYVSLGYTSLVDGVSGTFDPDVVCLENGESHTASLNLTGEPTGGPFTDRQIGTVTVTISQTPPAAMTATWKAGDTVDYIGKNGKAYSCYIVSESDGKYVLLTKEPEIFNTSSSGAASSELEALRKTQLEEVGAARYPTYRYDDEAEYLTYESYLDEVLPQNPYGNGGCFSPMVNEDGHDRWAYKSASSGNIAWGYSASGAKQGYFYYIFEVPVS